VFQNIAASSLGMPYIGDMAFVGGAKPLLLVQSDVIAAVDPSTLSISWRNDSVELNSIVPFQSTES